MKKLLMAVVVLAASASLAHAAAISEFDQFQGQFDGGIAGVGLAAGQIGGAGAGQLNFGYSAANAGDQASNAYLQNQIQNDFVAADDGAGNFAGSACSTQQLSTGNQSVGDTFGGPGVAGSAGAQGMVGGSAGVSAAGQFGIAGSAGAAGSLGGSAALGDASAAQAQAQRYDGVYNQQTVSPNGGYAQQAGTQSFATEQNSAAALAGVGVSGAAVIQAGGTAVLNDGQGTGMQGAGSAAGDAFAGAGSIGGAAAEAQAFGTQSHSYEQFNQSADATSQQFSQGTVTTTVNASAN